MPGDKSITHRAFIFGAISKGVTTVKGASNGDDCRSTRECLTTLGVGFESDRESGLIRIRGADSFILPAAALDCGNSGTTLRLLMGLLAGSSIRATLSGDPSLSRRPMERVARPLRVLGARIETTNGGPPVQVTGARLAGAFVAPEAASAQIKSAILLAALSAHGVTSLEEPAPTRDHTERMIRSFGGVLDTQGRRMSLTGPQQLTATDVEIPGDPSSAAPFIVAALVLPDSEVVIENVLLNPHRIRYLEILRAMGANIEVAPSGRASSEPSGRIVARSSALRGLSLSPADVPAVVDELPILAVAGAFAEGRFEVRGASELRVKESDRIASMVAGLGALGARVEEREDGFRVDGGPSLRGGAVDSQGDHRIAMALAVAALAARGDSEISDSAVVSISLPGFFDELERGAIR